MKSFADMFKNDFLISRRKDLEALLVENIGPPAAPESYPQEPEDLLRMHRIANVCVREEIILRKIGETPLRRVPPATQLAYLVGSAVHDAVRSRYRHIDLTVSGVCLRHILSPVYEDLLSYEHREVNGDERVCAIHLLGKWMCTKCLAEIGGNGKKDWKASPEFHLTPDGKICDEPMTYKELELRDYEAGLRGDPDGVLEIEIISGAPLYTLLEVKVLNEFNFENFSISLPRVYYWQVQGYLGLTGLTRATMLLVNKAARASKDMYSVLEVYRDEPVIEMICRKGREFRKAKDTGVLPEKICEKITDKRAGKCPVRDICFRANNETRLTRIGDVAAELDRIVSKQGKGRNNGNIE